MLDRCLMSRSQPIVPSTPDAVLEAMDNPKDPKAAAREQQADARAALAEARMQLRLAQTVPAAAEAQRMLATQPQDAPLASFALRVMSQHGEDGLIHEILRRAGMPTRRCVEIGCGANGGNSGLLVALGYRCLMVDGNEALTAIAANLYRDHDVEVVCDWIAPERVNALLVAHGFGGEIDCLSVDLDGIDFWVLEGLTAARPLLVVAEYNQLWPADANVTIPYSADFNRKARLPDGTPRWPKGYFGVGLGGLVAWGRRRGYRLVASHFGNAFLLRSDVCPDIPEISAADTWERKQKPRERPNIEALTNAINEAGGPIPYYAARGEALVEIA
jgi:hypothetical protein